MELKTLWLCMALVFLVFGLAVLLKPQWFLPCAWTLYPHHITPETIAHLQGESEAGQGGEAGAAGAVAFGTGDGEPAVSPVASPLAPREGSRAALRDLAAR
ncbi:hypothetical protein [Burkholderia plantarii]|uniref:Uncharacterized protein n=1 Tax=Burkholderia plantarii TaxID=41899 RepID=A0A0B6RYP0_BURPL|nr:hypothetical protein [Burkholderia plantarii]AJK48503.1 hypothetical protein BGL_2c04120 [Burkholderia plantarii]WLE61800.1 hypothetical protein GIY62_30660 [Burkholderia plantarii]